MQNIKVITEFKHPYTSPDYLFPDGCVNDNNNNNNFLPKLSILMGKKYSLLDLGCAGGQLVVDAMNTGCTAVGIEGGNVDEIVIRGAGANNWRTYENVCLFSADISKPFDILDEDGKLIKFDIVTAWDVLEHPAPEEIPFVIDNIKKYLAPDGMFLGTLNPTESHDEFMRHRCPRDKVWWDKMFEDKGFKVCEYPLDVTPRPYHGISNIDYTACFKLKD